MTIIEEEAKKRSQQPSPVTYKVAGQNSWDRKDSRNASVTILPRDKRVTEAQAIENKNKKPETSTPAPHHYSPNKQVILPKLNINTGSVSMKM